METNLHAIPTGMFHNFTFFEIENAWGLIRSDLGHNEEIQKFFSITPCFEGARSPKFDSFGRGEIFLTSVISP